MKYLLPMLLCCVAAATRGGRTNRGAPPQPNRLTAQLSVASWNLLAPLYAPPNRYPWANPRDLEWRHRQERILATLADIDADAVCLQEIEVDLWPDFCHRLNQLGYDAELQQTGHHPVACAILYRRGVLRCLRTESRSRALIAVLARADAAVSDVSHNSNLYLASVHLEAGAEKAAQRFHQMRSLLRRIQLQRANDVAVALGRPRALAPSTDAAGAPIVLAGDFNFDRRSQLYGLLSTGRAGKEGSMDVDVVSAKEFSHPFLPLADAYRSKAPPWGPQLRSSYRNGRLLDFVWHSDALTLLRPMPVPKRAGSTQPHRIPSSRHPSDHMPVGALLTWPGAPPARPSAPSWQQPYVESVCMSEGEGEGADVRY